MWHRLVDIVGVVVCGALVVVSGARESRVASGDETERLEVLVFEHEAPRVGCDRFAPPRTTVPATVGGLAPARRGETHPTSDRRLEVSRIVWLGDSIVADRGSGDRGGQYDVVGCLSSFDSVLASVSMNNQAVSGQTIGTEPPYSTSRGARLVTFVQDRFADGADIPDTVLLTPTLNELNVSPFPTGLQRVESALDDIEQVIRFLTDRGVANVIVLPTPPVAVRWGNYSGDGRRVAGDIALMNRRAVERGIIRYSIDYGLDRDGDGFGDPQYYDDNLDPAGEFDGAHLDVDGHDAVGREVFALLARLT